MLKADLHLHVKGDPVDDIKHTAEQLIDRASELHFDVLSITCHNKVIHSTDLADYAEDKGIHLIPGAEKTIEGKHVLIYNITNDDLKHLNSFSDLADLKKKKNVLIVAPHPYFPAPFSLGKHLDKHNNIFDAIEHSHYHTHFINFNKKAIKQAKQWNKPLIGGSDAHTLFQLGTTYSNIASAKTTTDILTAIKNGHLKHISPPLSIVTFSKVTAWLVWSLAMKVVNSQR